MKNKFFQKLTVGTASVALLNLAILASPGYGQTESLSEEDNSAHLTESTEELSENMIDSDTLCSPFRTVGEDKLLNTIGDLEARGGELEDAFQKIRNVLDTQESEEEDFSFADSKVWDLMRAVALGIGGVCTPSS
ncbi:MAG: hypothetical protein F6K14_13765 [Symploca sp. SIO2C1]|nr:hypothetical protein [Symploca sp. SIO2C1]